MFNLIIKAGLIASTGAMFLTPNDFKQNIKPISSENNKEVLVCKYETKVQEKVLAVTSSEKEEVKSTVSKVISNEKTKEVVSKEEVSNNEKETDDKVIINIPIKKVGSESLKVENNIESKEVTSSSTTKEENELITKVKTAVEKTKAADSVYYIRERTGIYPTSEKVKYSKSQNRRLYILDDMQEYVEGFANNYPPVATQGRVSSYYAQTVWSKKGDGSWVKQKPVIAYFGISELGWLNDIKAVELKGTRPFDYYSVTISKEAANKAAIDLLNAGYYLETGMFKSDVTILIQVDKSTGCIVTFDCNWGEEVLTNPNLGPITMSIRMGYYNSTTVSRPSDLKEEPDKRQKPSEELTQTQKYNIMNKIYDAFTKTYNVNSLTYETNGVVFKYDIEKNAAIATDNNSTTYYEGLEGNYIDHNYVQPKYHHESWTKLNNSDEWKQNTTKHKIFTPQELRFLDHSVIVINDVEIVETANNVTTYKIKVLKYGANVMYDHVYGEENKFNDDIYLTVSLLDNGYVSALKGDFGTNKLDLKLYDFNQTEVTRPEGIK